MKKQRTRELLLNSKAVENWNQSFDNKVDELMELVNKMDTPTQVQLATEVIDVYSKKKKTLKISKRKTESEERPFEFIVYHN